MSWAIKSFRLCQARIVFVQIVWAGMLGFVSGSVCIAVRASFLALQFFFLREHGLLPIAAKTLHPHTRVLIPLIGASIATLLLWVGKRWYQYEHFEDYIYAVHFRDGTIPFLSTAWRTLSAAFSITTGAAVGRESVMIQFSAATTSALGKFFKLNCFPLSQQVACGAASAVASIYGAPVAGICFASEIVLKRWSLRCISQLAVASLVGWLMHQVSFGKTPLFAVRCKLQNPSVFLFALLIAFLLLLTPLYLSMLKSMVSLKRLPLRLLWGGAAVGILSCKETMVWGNGDAALVSVLSGSTALTSIIFILFFRLLATTICIGSGTPGGIFTPTLFTGAAIGFAVGTAFHAVQPVLFAVLGVSIFLALVTQAPWMASFMAVELTKQWHLWPILIIGSLVAHTLSKYLPTAFLFCTLKMRSLKHKVATQI